jgi:hypothetical protein
MRAPFRQAQMIAVGKRRRNTRFCRDIHSWGPIDSAATSEVYCFDVEVSQIKIRSDPEPDFIGLEVSKSPLNRLLHWPVNSARQLELAGPCGAADL